MDAISPACGMRRMGPVLRRLMLLPTKASRLARYSATSIWSRFTPAGLVASAMALRVSPRFTVQVSPAAAFAATGALGSRAGLAVGGLAGATGSAAAGALAPAGGA